MTVIDGCHCPYWLYALRDYRAGDKGDDLRYVFLGPALVSDLEQRFGVLPNEWPLRDIALVLDGVVIIPMRHGLDEMQAKLVYASGEERVIGMKWRLEG